MHNHVMRPLLILFFLLFSQSGFAQEWNFYAPADWSYFLEIPPGFVAQEEEEDERKFIAKRLAAKLIVWADYLVVEDGGFEQEVIWRIAADIERGWNISYHTTQPQSVSYSGLNSDNSRIFYQRMIALPVCEGRSYAAFRLEYDRADRVRFDSIIRRMVATFGEDFAAGVTTKCLRNYKDN